MFGELVTFLRRDVLALPCREPTCVPRSNRSHNPLVNIRMPPKFPYAYICCPCSSLLTSPSPLIGHSDSTPDEPLNPHDSRSSFSLYPAEHLLFCEECQGIRCPRCSYDEIALWYCPSCLFEVPGSAVKGEGSR